MLSRKYKKEAGRGERVRPARGAGMHTLRLNALRPRARRVLLGHPALMVDAVYASTCCPVGSVRALRRGGAWQGGAYTQ